MSTINISLMDFSTKSNSDEFVGNDTISINLDTWENFTSYTKAYKEINPDAKFIIPEDNLRIYLKFNEMRDSNEILDIEFPNEIKLKSLALDYLGNIRLSGALRADVILCDGSTFIYDLNPGLYGSDYISIKAIKDNGNLSTKNYLDYLYSDLTKREVSIMNNHWFIISKN